MCEKGFYGARLNIRDEQSGVQVVFASLVWVVVANVILTRIHNPNLSYQEDRTSCTLSRDFRHRYVSGHEYQTKIQQLGQAFGHLSRIVDASNAFSAHMIPLDICMLYYKLRRSGWRHEIFKAALNKFHSTSPNLDDILDMSWRLVDSLHYCGD